MLSETFTIGNAQIDPTTYSVSNGDNAVRIEPRLMNLLLRLKRQTNQVVPRNVLIEDVWGDEHGSDEALTQAISRLRSILGNKETIETIPKVGYRLIEGALADQSNSAPIKKAQGFRPTQTQLLWTAILVLLAIVLFKGAQEPQFEMRQIEIILKE